MKSGQSSGRYFATGLASERANRALCCTQVMVKTINSLLPHNWVMYRRYGKEYWCKHNRGKHSISIEKLLDEHSYIVQRPSEETMFQRLLHGVCPYEACQQGLVPVNDYVARVLRSFREPVRNRNTT